jgi:hypothetical protein
MTYCVYVNRRLAHGPFTDPQAAAKATLECFNLEEEDVTGPQTVETITNQLMSARPVHIWAQRREQLGVHTAAHDQWFIEARPEEK